MEIPQDSTFSQLECTLLSLLNPTDTLSRALTTMKNRLKGAHTGHSLLKRKAEALTRRFRDIVKKIDEV